MKLLYIDLFCGAGGTSSGVNSARLDDKQCAQVVACVNHDKNAIASHAANHPEAMHFTEDIRTLELSPLLTHLQSCRRQYPDALVVLWATAVRISPPFCRPLRMSAQAGSWWSRIAPAWARLPWKA